MTSPIILGVNSLATTYHHDNGAFLFYGDKYVGISSERLDRIKQSSGFKTKVINGVVHAYAFDMGQSCIDYCLEYFGLSLGDVDLLVYIEGNHHELQKKFSMVKEVVQVPDHHYIHACSSFFSSGFTEAAILTIDGQGKKVSNNGGDDMVVQAMFYGRENSIITLKETCRRGKRRIGIGSLYQMITRLLGLSSEGSTMGLSSYGSEDKSIFGGKSFFSKYEDDIFLDDYFLSGVPGNKLKHLDNNILLEKLGITADTINKGALYEGYTANLAYKLQQDTQDSIVQLAQDIYEKTQSKNLCIAGGVGLNSIANKLILDRASFEQVYIVPGTDDSGLALGAALYGRDIILGQEKKFTLSNAFCGKQYSQREIDDAIEQYRQYFSSKKVYISESEKYRDVASLIAEGEIVGCFFGSSEFGPRALGHRSIIGDPRSVENREKLNRIKGREQWRPIAPAILEEYTKEYFDIEVHSDFMLFIAEVLEAKKNDIPGVVHVDQTARLQTVSENNCREFFGIITEFLGITGIPVIMNSSFNFKGEPIVETPEQAICSFLSSNLDALILENTLLRKKDIYSEFAFQKPQFLTEHLEKESRVYRKKEELLKKYNYARMR